VKEVQLCAVLQLLVAVLLSQLLPCVRTRLRAAAVVAAAAAVAAETALRSSSGVPRMQLLSVLNL
jgi:ABC-type nitrate/sulfonate/bicarbonate transport system permease component